LFIYKKILFILLFLLSITALTTFSLTQIYYDIIGIVSNSQNLSDLTQDYLAARELNSGLNPYQNLFLLLKKYHHLDYANTFFHATPHTPIIIYIISLLNSKNLIELKFLFYLIQITSFFIVFWFIGTRISVFKDNYFYKIIFIFILLGSDPVRMELILGQWNFIILFFIAYLVFFEKKSTPKSIIIGMTICIKNIGMIFPLYFLISKKYKQFFLTILGFLSILSLTFHKFTLEMLKNYYITITQDLVKYYLFEPNNSSLLSIFSTAFRLINVSKLDTNYILSILFTIFTLTILTYNAKSIRNIWIKFQYLLIISILSLPILWIHTLLLLIPGFIKISCENLKHFSLSSKLYVHTITIILFWYFIRQPSLFLHERILNQNLFLYHENLSIFGIWTTIYLAYYLLYLRLLDNELYEREYT
jgi:hypothetical protein